MSKARTEVLARIHAALGDARPPRRQPSATPTVRPGDLQLFSSRVADHGAPVTAVDGEDAIPAALTSILTRHRAERIGVPPDLPADWLPAGLGEVRDDPPLAHRALEQLDGAITGSSLAIAGTGTVVLAGARSGRRALTLLPDLHVCVVRAETLVADVTDGVAAIAGLRGPITFVSGPSATSDIELERVEGVHGPRRLEIVLVAES